MAGFVFLIGNDRHKSVLENCICNGYYSTTMKEISDSPASYKSFEGTFADFCSMKPGDNVYFFHQRKIYGIGELIRIGKDCKFQNYPNSTIPINYEYNTLKKQMILCNESSNINNRWICIFKPSPHFFCCSVDMDDVLSYKPDTFKSLRTLWNKSFVKISDEENNSLKEIIMLRNIESQNYYEFSPKFHNNNIDKFSDESYLLSYTPLLDVEYNIDNSIKREMAIEAALVDVLSTNSKTLFGHWDYISHQVAASPFKPIDYMDKIDIFGYKYIPETNIISKYLIIEIKKDRASEDTAGQLIKYVDWVAKNYCYGNYNMIEAYIVAYNFAKKLKLNGKSIVERRYQLESHSSENKIWNNLNLISYRYENSMLKLKKEED